MTYKELLYVTTIFDEGSFSAAAKKLYISQSALSQTVRKTEQEFGLVLFSRNGIRAEPTKAGQYFIEQGRNVLQAWDEFDRKLHFYAESSQFEMTVGLPAGLVKNLLPFVIPRFEETHPNVKLNIIEERSNTLELLAMQDSINLCVIHEPVYIEAVGRTRVFMSELLLAVPKTHPFCKQHPYQGLDHLESVDLSEFRTDAFSLLKHQRVDHMWDPIFTEAGFKPIIYRRSSVWNNIKDYIKQGLSLALIDEIFVRHEPDDEKVAYYRINSEHTRRYISVAYCPGKHLSKQERWFVEALKEYPCIGKDST